MWKRSFNFCRRFCLLIIIDIHHDKFCLPMKNIKDCNKILLAEEIVTYAVTSRIQFQIFIIHREQSIAIMRSLHSLFIPAILYCVYYYLHPSTAGCMTRECIENMIWHFCQLNAFAFPFSAYRFGCA